MFLSKKGLNIITGGKIAGDEIKIKTILFSDIVFVVANLVGLGIMAWILWPLF